MHVSLRYFIILQSGYIGQALALLYENKENA